MNSQSERGNYLAASPSNHAVSIRSSAAFSEVFEDPSRGMLVPLDAREAQILVTLYQALTAQWKLHVNAPFEAVNISADTLLLLARCRMMMDTKRRMLPEISTLINTYCAKAQRLSIVGSGSEQGSLEWDLDFALFPELRTLTLHQIRVINITGVDLVASLVLNSVEIAAPSPVQRFQCLRSVEVHHSLITATLIAALSAEAFSLRRLQFINCKFDVSVRALWPQAATDRRSLGIAIWSALSAVTLSFVPITLLDRSWERLQALGRLVLTSCGISDVRQLSELSRCTALRSLDISHNMLRRLTTAQGDAGVDQYCPDLRILVVSHNSIESLHGVFGMEDLEVLLAEGNELRDWADMALLRRSCPALVNVSVIGNAMLGDLTRCEDVIPLIRCVFADKPKLVINGVIASSRRKMALAEYQLKYSHLFEASAAIEDADSIYSAPDVASPNPRVSKASNRRATSACSEGSLRRRVTRGTKKVLRRPVVVDDTPYPMPNETRSVQFANNSFHNPDTLFAKYGDRWLQVLNSTRTTPLVPSERKEVPEAPPQELNAEAQVADAPHKRLRKVVKRVKKTVDEPEEKAPLVVPDIPLPLQGTASRGKKHARVKVPTRQPTPLLNSFLSSLTSSDWLHTEGTTRTRLYPTGCTISFFGFSEENSALWGLVDAAPSTSDHDGPKTLMTELPTTIELYLHDSRDVAHHYRNRFAGKGLVRLVEYHVGSTRQLRLEVGKADANGAQATFEPVPVFTVYFREDRLTQPAPTLLSVSQGGKKGSTLEAAELDASAAARDILRAAMPALIAAFVVDVGPAMSILINRLRGQLATCQGRLAELRFVEEWPRCLDETRVVRDRAVDSVMSESSLLERVRREETSAEDLLYRDGCATVFSGEELRLVVEHEVLSGHLKGDQIRLVTYANLDIRAPAAAAALAKSGNNSGDPSAFLSPEESVLLVVAKRSLFICRDRNFHKGATKGKGAKNIDPPQVFPLITAISMATLRRQTKSVTVNFNLQAIGITDGDVRHILRTRSRDVTLAILNVLFQEGITLNPKRCPIEAAAPLVFSVDLFMRPQGPTTTPGNQSCYPLRLLDEQFAPVTLAIISTDLFVFSDMNPFNDNVPPRMDILKTDIKNVVSYGASVDPLSPLLFSISTYEPNTGVTNTFVFMAQHPQSLAYVFMELRALCPSTPVDDLTLERLQKTRRSNQDQTQAVESRKVSRNRLSGLSLGFGS